MGDLVSDRRLAMGSGQERTIRVFVSYSHKDKDLFDALDEHLASLKREEVIEAWSDRHIIPGDDWNAEIADELEKADLILLLVSPAFLNSNYCYEQELQRAIARHEAGAARVVPIILRPCHWKPAIFAHLHGLPQNMKPITSWPKNKLDMVLADIVRGIDEAARVCLERRAPLGSPAKSIASTSPAKGESSPHASDPQAMTHLHGITQVRDDIEAFLKTIGHTPTEVTIRNWGFDLSTTVGWIINYFEDVGIEGITYRALVIDWTSPYMQELFSVEESDASPSQARDSVEKLREFSRRRAHLLRSRKIAVEVRGYSVLPVIHGFLIGDQRLYFGLTEISGGVILGARLPYMCVTASDKSAMVRHLFGTYKSWFEHVWSRSTPILKFE
jgi:hypothetical protein